MKLEEFEKTREEISVSFKKEFLNIRDELEIKREIEKEEKRKKKFFFKMKKYWRLIEII